MATEDDYAGEHVLPRRWWDSLPDFAKAVWLKAYREFDEQGDRDPATAAWDRVREQYIWWQKEGWLRKDSLTAYRQTTDGSRCLWLDNDWQWLGWTFPEGDLSLPGNRYVSEGKAANLTGKARKVYEERYRRAEKSGDKNPHEIACRVLRARFRETEKGWEEKPEEERDRKWSTVRERIQVQLPMFDSIWPDDDVKADEQMVRGEYPLLPESLKWLYRKGYKEGLREQHHSPIWRGWQAITSEFINDKGTWKRRPAEQREKRVRKGDKRRLQNYSEAPIESKETESSG